MFIYKKLYILIQNWKLFTHKYIFSKYILFPIFFSAYFYKIVRTALSKFEHFVSTSIPKGKVWPAVDKTQKMGGVHK